MKTVEQFVDDLFFSLGAYTPEDLRNWVEGMERRILLVGIETYGKQEYERGIEDAAKIAEKYVHHDGDHMTEVGRLIRALKT